MRRALLLFSIAAFTAAAQQPVPVQYSGAPAFKLDVVFLGDGFTHDEMRGYRQIVDGYKDAILALPPFSSHTNAFNFWRVDVESKQSGITKSGTIVDTALGVNFDGDRAFYSDHEDRVGALARGAGFVPELIVVIANDGDYGGAERAGFVYVSLDPAGMKILQHEVGHSFCIDPNQRNCINDEYTEETYAHLAVDPNDWGILPPNLVPPVCYPETSWCKVLNCRSGPPAGVACKQGGISYGEGVYHAQDGCKMNTIDGDFCPICRRVIQKILGSYSSNGESTLLRTSAPPTRTAARLR